MDSQPSILSEQTQKKSILLPILLSILITIIIIISAMFLFWQKYNSLDNNFNKSSLSNSTSAHNVTNDNINNNTLVENKSKNQINNEYITITNVTWSEPKELSNLKLINDYDPANPSKYFKVGTITEEPYKDSNIILAESPVSGVMSAQFEYSRFIVDSKTNTLLTRYSTSNMNSSDFVEVAPNFKIQDLELPKIILDSKKNIYKLDESSLVVGDGSINLTNLTKSFNNPFVGDVYNSTQDFKNNSFKFYVKSPDKTQITYIYTPDFLVSKETTYTVNIDKGDIQLNDGKTNEAYYIIDPVDSCEEGKSYVEAVEANPNVSLADLKKIGTLKTGDTVYTFSDPNNPYLKNFTYGENNTYTDPSIILWQDNFGRLIRFVNRGNLEACGGKPVIYLYPEKTEKVEVSLNIKNGFSITEPNYDNGWSVIAEPNGQLTDLKTNKKYPYLFWEGGLAGYQIPEEGFVVKKENVSNFFQEKLSYIGLNQQEITDFSDFWVRRMQNSPFYFITFSFNDTINKLAPLSVNPKPDSIIRVLMDYKPLNTKISAPELKLQKIERVGFTLVEWGGILK